MSNETVIASLQEKIDDLNQQAWELRVTDLPKAFELSQESVKLARSIDYPKGLAEGLRSLGFSYVRFFKNDEAAPLLKESLSLFQSLNDLKGQAVIYEYLGIIERNWGNLGASLDLLLKAYEIVLQTGPLEVEITCSYQLGVTYKHLGNHENALDYLYKTLSLAKKINYPLMEAYATNIIGSIYFDNGNYNQALDCYQQGLPIRQQSHDKWGEAGSLDNIGFTYLKLNDLDKAIDYCKQSLTICQATGDKKGEANALLHLGEIYEQAGDVKQAARFSNESLEIRKARGDKRGETEVLLFLADLHKNRNDVEDHQIFEWLSGALKIADEIKAQDLLSKAYYNLHEYYQQKGNFKESLVQLEAHFQIEKELHKNSINQKIANLEISHKAEVISQRNKELTLLNEQIERANEELKIEASLERVRAVAMGMKKPDDLLSICEILFKELETLGFKDLRNAMINIYYDERKSFLNYDFSGSLDRSITVFSMVHSHPVPEYITKQIRQANSPFAEIALTGEQLRDWIDFREKNGELPDPKLKNASTLCYYFYSVGTAAIGISTLSSITKKEHNILKRFRNVFDLAYKRYTDIEKAEAQAREAQIEVALERVRAKVMAMTNSKELNATSLVFGEQLRKLNIDWQFSYFWLIDEAKHDTTFWITWPDYKTSLTAYTMDEAAEYFNDCLVAWRGGVKIHDNYVPPEGVQAWLDTFQRIANDAGGVAKEIMVASTFPTGVYYYDAMMKYGSFGICISKPATDEEKKIQCRFAIEFERAYSRFLDLKQAEAQTREAKIEASLERVRAKAMAMHKSDDFNDAVAIVFEELDKLSLGMLRCGIGIFNKEKRSAEVWTTTIAEHGRTVQVCGDESMDLHPLLKGDFAAWLRQEDFSYVLEGEDMSEYYRAVMETNFKLPESQIMVEHPEHLKQLYYAAMFESGSMFAFRETDFPEEAKVVMKRFAGVFNLTYKRFLDLQKAEAQTREAKIEAALERVRAKAMAMHKSEDLNPAVATVFEELDKLNIGILRCGIAIMDKEKPRGDVWITVKSEQSNTIQVSGDESLDYHPLLLGAYKGWLKQEDFSYVLQGDDLIGYYRDVASIKYQLPVSTSFDTEKKDQQQYYYNAVFQDGSLFAFMETAITDEAKTVMKRFANVFNLTYKRFLDLQKAEAQTREAKIETALERVRARALAMQEPEELKDVAQVLRSEMGLLGVEELETCSIYINDEATNKTECWYALKDLRAEENKLVSDHFPLNLNDTWVGREMKNFYRSDAKQASIVMQGANRKEWINYCEERSVPFRGYYGEVIPDRTYHLYKFSHGAIGAAAAGDISAESWKLLSRAASVFSLAYSRFKDLTQARIDLVKLKEEKKRAEDALTELQATQKQLIQSEKMASLGELTAGIAHEIQNPLNFVNNFSDVSNELLEEMKAELEKGNAEEAKLIAVDVKENLEKILHHGKRADAIVKGMLQHSRTSTGQKEPTDINILVEEYLRLAYHGLRAKDKFFNAKFETDLDPSITKINIVPQEIGRVILNLINNSFYAVTEKKRTVSNGYEPMVTVSTKAVKPPLGGLGVVEIRVVDNGNGIPQKVLDKIFQPFFTTKPTGQGTGLGLSLSYDIVTKGHDGEIKVETKEGEGSAFTISLPMK